MSDTPKHPSHTVWFVPKRENARWVAIGALWPTKNGSGFNMNLDLVPRSDGGIVVMPYEPSKEK